MEEAVNVPVTSTFLKTDKSLSISKSLPKKESPVTVDPPPT